MRTSRNIFAYKGLKRALSLRKDNLLPVFFFLTASVFVFSFTIGLHFKISLGLAILTLHTDHISLHTLVLGHGGGDGGVGGVGLPLKAALSGGQ